MNATYTSNTPVAGGDKAMSQGDLAALYGKPLAELSIYFRDHEGRAHIGTLRLTTHALALLPPTALRDQTDQLLVPIAATPSGPQVLVRRLVGAALQRGQPVAPDPFMPQPLRQTDLTLDGLFLRLCLGPIRMIYKPTEYDREAAPDFIRRYNEARAVALS